jgi:rRNA maturation endonuclease Nob1
MYKVKCIGCGNIGYTAAPHQVKCSECGGRHRIIKARMIEEPKKEGDIDESLDHN